MGRIANINRKCNSEIVICMFVNKFINKLHSGDIC
jgi:hypothetical protein